MELVGLTQEQQAEVERIQDLVMAKARVEIDRMARLLVSKADHELFGQTEYRLRDACRRLGAAALDAAVV